MRHLFLGFLFLGYTSAWAEESVNNFNRVDFQVEASREVHNDLLVAQLSIDVEEKLPAQVAQKLNLTLNNSLKSAARFTSVKTSSGNQSSYPSYNTSNHINGWHGRSELHLESHDFKAVGELIAELQSTLQVNHVHFTITEEAQKKIENELITEAIHNFQDRADAIRNAMGATSYKIVHFSINQSGATQAYPMVAMMRTVNMEKTITTPDFSGGDSRLNVQINGTIETK